jgi:hypothetical protein
MLTWMFVQYSASMVWLSVQKTLNTSLSVTRYVSTLGRKCLAFPRWYLLKPGSAFLTALSPCNILAHDDYYPEDSLAPPGLYTWQEPGRWHQACALPPSTSGFSELAIPPEATLQSPLQGTLPSTVADMSIAPNQFTWSHSTDCNHQPSNQPGMAKMLPPAPSQMFPPSASS